MNFADELRQISNPIAKAREARRLAERDEAEAIADAWVQAKSDFWESKMLDAASYGSTSYDYRVDITSGDTPEMYERAIKKWCAAKGLEVSFWNVRRNQSEPKVTAVDVDFRWGI